MKKALATLQFVEQSTVKADVTTQLVTFKVTDKSKFDLDKVKEALKNQGFPKVEMQKGPA